MKYIARALEKQVAQAARHFPAVVLTGPRRAGKTMLLRRLYPKASYFLVEDPDVVARLRADPQGFLDAVKTPAILDEVQHLEVDFLMPGRGGSVALVECKAGRTVTPGMAAPMQRLAEALKRKRAKTADVPMFLVHREPKVGTPTQAVSPGVCALPWQRFLDEQ